MGLRVALIGEGSARGIGGIAIHVNELGRALRADGHDVTVVGPEQFNESRNLARLRIRRVERAPAPPLPVWELPLVWSPRRALTRWQVRWRLRPWLHRLLARAGTQVVHWHGIDIDCVITAGLPSGVARIFTNHSSQFLEMSRDGGPPLWRRFAHAQRVIAPSAELVDRTVAVGVPADRVHHLANGVDSDRYHPDPVARARFRGALGLAADEIVTVCARRFVPKNGLIHLAGAVARLEATGGAPTTLLLAGNGAEADRAYESAVRSALAGCGRRVRIVWLGWVPSERMPSLFAASDVAILPSLVEATSLAGLEAMASGCALVGSRTGGIPEIVEDGRTGLLVSPGDPDALAAAWGRLLDDRAQRSALGVEGRRAVVAGFTWSAVARSTVEIYRHALAELRGRL
jgi:glycosyltransferase involved in cell wall biosynthesis